MKDSKSSLRLKDGGKKIMKNTGAFLKKYLFLILVLILIFVSVGLGISETVHEQLVISSYLKTPFTLNQKEISFSGLREIAKTPQRVEKAVIVSKSFLFVAHQSAYIKLADGSVFWADLPQHSAFSMADQTIFMGGEVWGDKTVFPGWLVVMQISPFFLFIIVIVSARGMIGGDALNFLKNKAKRYMQGKQEVTFNNVAGVDEAKQELQEVVDFLKGPERFENMGARIPRGVLLVGPAGTGKTLMARAVAGEAKVPFFSLSASEFVEMFVGVGASRVRDLFGQAKLKAPCIIFIDEIDAVGRHRGAGLGHGHDEREQTLNQILVEMDGFDVRTNVIVMAATNRPDILDPALLRPGRFDRRVTFDLPDAKARKEILDIHAKGKPIPASVDLTKVAKQTFGFSGADLENLLNEAAILTVRGNKLQIGAGEIGEAIDRVVAGPQRKSKVISPEEKTRIAYHEAGHALVGWVLPNVDPLRKISIVARGRIGGYARFVPEEDRSFKTKSQMQDELAMLLGGRVAEEFMDGGESSTGAESDLEEVRKISRKMVLRYGMADNLPPQTFGEVNAPIFLGKEISEQRDYGDDIASKLDAARTKIVERAYRDAKEAIGRHPQKMEEIVQRLIDEETIEGEALEKLFESVPREK